MKSFSVRELAKKISAQVIGDDTVLIARVAPIHAAQQGDLTFVASSAYKRFLSATQASAVLVTQADAMDCPTTALVVSNPELAFARLAQLWNQVAHPPAAGIHPTVIIGKNSIINPSASIGAYCVIGECVHVGANTVLQSAVIVQDGVTIGDDCWLHHHVTLCHRISIANRVRLHSGVVIGSDGFGLAQDQGCFEKIPQLGSVVIHDDVEIGANSCVDRGALENTIIEKGVKIDNLVQVAHNVIIGENTIIAGCSSVAGSTKIGAHCLIGGSVNIGGHITICDGAMFTGCAMVTNSVKKPGVYSSGTGLFPNSVWRKIVARWRRGHHNERE